MFAGLHLRAFLREKGHAVVSGLCAYLGEYVMYTVE